MGYQRKRKRRRRRRRHEEELIPQTVKAKDPVDEVQNALKNPALMNKPETIMAMQSVLGNKAVQRVLSENADVIDRAEAEDGQSQTKSKGEKQKNSKQEDQQVEQRKDTNTTDNEEAMRRMNERIEAYSMAAIKLEEVFPKQDLTPMLDVFGEMGYMPEEDGYLMEIIEGKHPEYLPAGKESVYALSEEDAEASKRAYFFSDEVRDQMLKLEIIMSMFFPKDVIMQKIMENPVVSVTGMDGNLLGVTGLGNSAALSDQLNVKAQINEYAPIARVLHLDQARKLAELDVELFRVMLQDILPEHELEDILKALEQFIKQLKKMVAKDDLMRQPEWNEAKRRGMLDKDSTSFDQVIVTLNALPR